MSTDKIQNKIANSNPHNYSQKRFGQYFQSIFITCLLYPLKRIQSNLQIQKSYAKQEIKNCKQFFTRCTHYGLRSLFRGLTPFVLNITVPYTIYHMSQNLFNLNDVGGHSQSLPLNNNQILELAKVACLAAGYTLIYPFQNARLRMGANVESQRVYRNLRDCTKKMSKVEGKSSFFKGYALSLPYFLLQYLSAIKLYKYLVSKQNQQNFPSLLKTQTGFSLFLISYLTTQTILYPFDSIRKNLQINASLNHNNICAKYRDVIRFNNFIDFYKGFSYKLLIGLLYSSIVIGLQKSREQYSH